MEATKSIFCETFGDSPYVRVLDHFLTFSGLDYSKSQVAGATGVSRVTVDKIWGQLLDQSLIIRTRGIGRAEMYSLNIRNPSVKLIQELDFNLAKLFAKQQAPLKQEVRVPRK